MMNFMKISGLCLLISSGVVMADDVVAPVAEQADQKPAQDKLPRDSIKHPIAIAWLDIQRSGDQASDVPQTLTPLIQERVVKRYLDSFNAPIPVFFTDSSGSSKETN